MRLALSSLVAPELAADALDAACRARGLDGVELALGDADALIASVRAADVRVVALRPAAFDAGNAEDAARASVLLRAPVVLPVGALASQRLRDVTRTFARAGGRLLLGFATRLDEARELRDAVRAIGAPATLGLAWDVRPSSEPLGDAKAIVAEVHEWLGLIRLHGGGPEQHDQDGRGVGALFAELALAGCTAPVVLCPSRAESLPRWRAWLASRKRTACGSKLDDRTVTLDVRPVEPRDRLETILGAYRALSRGEVLRLTVDHDPSCMYYTLEATEPERSFAFAVLENGPEVWRAEVTKL